MRISDWSSDVGSSDLFDIVGDVGRRARLDILGTEDGQRRRRLIAVELDARAGNGDFGIGRRDGPGGRRGGVLRLGGQDRKRTRLNSSHKCATRMPPNA